MNFSTMSLAYTGSVACTRRKTSPLRGIALYRSFKLSFALLRRRGLGPLRSILRTSLLAVLHARGIQRSAHDVIAHSGQILHAAAAHQYDRVLLQVVADAGNISRHFDRIRQANTRHFAQCRVRFLRRVHSRVHADAEETELGTAQ